MAPPRDGKAPRLGRERGAKREGQDEVNVPHPSAPVNPPESEPRVSLVPFPLNVWQKRCPACLRWFRVTRGDRQRSCLAPECRAELRRRRQREDARLRYANDPEARAANRLRAGRYYKRHRARVLARQAQRLRERYATDPAFREIVKERARLAYRRRRDRTTNPNTPQLWKDTHQ